MTSKFGLLIVINAIIFSCENIAVMIRFSSHCRFFIVSKGEIALGKCMIFKLHYVSYRTYVVSSLMNLVITILNKDEISKDELLEEIFKVIQEQ